MRAWTAMHRASGVKYFLIWLNLKRWKLAALQIDIIWLLSDNRSSNNTPRFLMVPLREMLSLPVLIVVVLTPVGKGFKRDERNWRSSALLSFSFNLFCSIQRLISEMHVSSWVMASCSEWGSWPLEESYNWVSSAYKWNFMLCRWTMSPRAVYRCWKR